MTSGIDEPAPVAAVNRLRRLAAAVRDGGPFHDGEWLAQALAVYLEGAPLGVTLEDAMGLTPRPGGEPWWRTARRRERDDALREIAATAHSATTLPGLVDYTRRLLRGYAVRWQRTDCRLAECPARYAGTVDAALYAAMRSSGGNPPMSPRRLGPILQPLARARENPPAPSMISRPPAGALVASDGKDTP